VVPVGRVVARHPDEVVLQSSVSERGMWWRMRSVPSRFSDWVVAHPVVWAVGVAVVLVLLGVAFDLEPIVIVAAGGAIGALNILHARRRGYCPLPTERSPRPVDAHADSPIREGSDD
jgi:hypothetical protein